MKLFIADEKKIENYLLPEKIEDFSNVPRKRLRIEIKGQKLSTPLSLPLINHFEEMRRGAIQTYIDPQLSQW